MQNYNTADLNLNSEKIHGLEAQQLQANTDSQSHRHLASTLEEAISKTACVADASDDTKLWVDSSCVTKLAAYPFPCFADSDAVD